MDDRTDAGAPLFASIDLALDPAKAFEVFVDELAGGLARRGMRFESGPAGRILEGDVLVGRVVEWRPGSRVRLDWHPADWRPDEVAGVELRFDAVTAGTRITIEVRGWEGSIGEPVELAGWFAGEVAAPLLRATGPAALGDWVTDRGARRPAGDRARATYGDPLYHYPNFRVILEELALTADDHFLEVGCGGGALLKDALRSGCRAAAVDHSPDMARLAREANRDAVDAGRLDVHEAGAERLPFRDGTFSCAAMTGVLGFLEDPVGALAEIRRVLRPGGRLVVLGSDPELRGTPGAPEPMASRLRFYDDQELEALGREAGFADARAVRRDLEAHARAVGVPEEHLPLFAGSGTRFLLARRD